MKELSFLQNIDGRVNLEDAPKTDLACIQERDAIIYALLENLDDIPEGITISACTNDSVHDLHHWVEVQIENGPTIIWDRTRQKITNKNFATLEEAQQLWSDYGRPTDKLQIIPLVEN